MRILLSWDGCKNVRDLGGYPLPGGGVTRAGAIVRADSVRQLSDEGWQALVDYGIRTVVDLRLPSELDGDPPGGLPVEFVHAPLVEELDANGTAEIDAIADAHGDDAVSATRDVYLEMLERNHAGVAGAVTAVAGAPPGGVLVHCHAGKDRTGLVAALLLDLAGVDRTLIGEDYAQTGVSLAEVLAEWVDEAVDEADRLRRRRIVSTPAQAIVGVLGVLDARYGSPREFLRAAGVTESDLGRAVARLAG
jgi:hypothetical protein